MRADYSKIAMEFPFGLIEHVGREGAAVAHCLPRRTLPNILHLQQPTFSVFVALRFYTKQFVDCRHSDVTGDLVF